MDQYIHLDSEIVNNPNFESGLVNILNKEFSSMSRLENMATIGLKTITGGEYLVLYNYYNTDSPVRSFELCCKSMRTASTEENGGYIDC